MKSVPNRLKCYYCAKNVTHGGECKGKSNPTDEIGCAIFKADKRGCIKNGDYKIPVALYADIPKVNVWCDYYGINGVDTEIRITKIYDLEWDRNKGLLWVYCNCDHFINEYSEDYIEPKNKTILSIVKGGI